jgi:hypothetical protein
LNDTGNTLQYIRGEHKKVMYPPIVDELPNDKVKEIQKFCKKEEDKFLKSRMSLRQIAEKFGVDDWTIFKRIIYNV